MKSILKFILFVSVAYIFVSCSRFLDAKPVVKMATPEKADDLFALLNDVNNMNYNYTGGLSEIASDNIYIVPAVWKSITIEEFRNSYTWTNFINAPYWDSGYRKVGVVNVVLDNMSEVGYKSDAQRDELYGIAQFMRSYSYFELAQVFTKPYSPQTISELGLVIRKNSDINEKSTRSTIAETYRVIVDGFKDAAKFLPSSKPLYPTRPYKASAFAALARVFLVMNDYNNAKIYADSCIMLDNTLMDYSTFETKSYPFQKFNPEVLFYAQIFGSGILTEAIARVDENLYNSYTADDHRKRLFFQKKIDGFYAFVGDYGRNSTASKFAGLTTAEVFLVQAECLVRLGDLDGARKSIGNLLSKRYNTSGIPQLIGMDKDELLRFVLDERRKELLFRGLRWPDMRRLTKDELAVSGWTRDLGSDVYTMNKEEIMNFAFKIPQRVIELSGIPQND